MYKTVPNHAWLCAVYLGNHRVGLSTLERFSNLSKDIPNTVSWFHLIQLWPNHSFCSQPVKLMRYDWRNCGPCWDPTSLTKELKRHPSLKVVFTGFFVLWVLNLVRNVKLLQNMVYNTTQHPHPLPHSHTPPSVFTVRLLWEEVEGWGRSERR